MSRFTLAPLLFVLAAPLAAQRVPVTLTASLTGENGKLLPVSGRFWFVTSDGRDSVAATTDGTGNARLELLPGGYRVRSHQRASLGGRGFFWDLPVTVSGPTQVELSSANAQESAPSGDVIMMDAPPPPEDAGSRRTGFWIGFGPAIGFLNCEDCVDSETSGAGTLHLGGTVSPKLRIGVSTDVWVKEENGDDLSQTNLTAIVQYFPSTKHGLRFTGGLGMSVLAQSQGDTTFDEEGFGLTLGVAYEAMVARKFALAPYISFHSGSFDHGNSHFWLIGLAATWP